MDSIQTQLGLAFRFAIATLFIAIAWFILTAVYPTLGPTYLWKALRGDKATSTWNTIFSLDWVPTPRLIAPKTGPGVAFEPVKPFNEVKFSEDQVLSNQSETQEVKYVVYSGDGSMSIVDSPYGTKNTTNTTQVVTRILSGDRSLYVRNLTTFEGAYMYKGAKFRGEAISGYFKNGKFPIGVRDVNGKTGIIGVASSTGGWAPYGWTEFEVRIDAVLPDGACTIYMINPNGGGAQMPSSVPMAMKCRR